ncbi:coiled-coil domain-containing protein 146 [Danio rerio]|uniref:Coiled-coil domain-containing 146 n=1 Tax=Danio rerio TaxID=7955 RepID=Q5TYU2_DANRE|nr:coiled-coil domain-containing protein 146 [Danio rerio]|eukprot:NP_001076522.1 coiled-coil domain-containing protein 146 [Danio rerio]
MMRQAQQRSSSPSHDDQQESSERATPISALAPEVDLNQEQPAVLSLNPALQCLEQLFSTGKISVEKVARLKASFNLLNETLRSSQDSEMQLLLEAKTLRMTLEQQRQELENAELFPEGPDTEVSRLKQTLLQYYNQLKEDEERDYQMQFQLECLKEEKLYLEKEYQDQPKQAELESRYATLKNSCEEVRKEVLKLRQEVRTLTESMETQQKHIKKEQLELEDLKNRVESNEAELAQVLLIPVQLRKEVDRVAHKKSELEKQVAKIEQHRLDNVEHQKSLEAKCEKVKEAIKEVVREQEGHKAQLVTAENKQDRLLTDLQMAKAKEAAFMDQRSLFQHFCNINAKHIQIHLVGLLEISMEQIVAEFISLRDKLARDTRLKDKLMLALKRNELQLKQARDALTNTQQQHERIQAQKETVSEADILLERRKDLEKEVENLKRNLISELKYKQSKQELQGKGLVIQEHIKQTKETQTRLLQRSRLQHSHSYKLRDDLKKEVSQTLQALQEMQQNREEQKLKLRKLTDTVNMLEQKKLHICKRYEAELQKRNQESVQLAEREKEWRIFNEKLGVLVKMTENSNLEMYDMEDEIRNLKMEQKEEERQNDLHKKQLSNKLALEEERVLLQIQLSEINDRVSELEEACVDDNRARNLNGEDPSPEELIEKIEQLEIHLADKEAQLLEMELVCEQVGRLSKRIQIKADNSNEDTLHLAKKVNELQAQIRKRSRKMMAVVAELSMRKAECMGLQQEMKEKELQLDLCQKHVEQGLPPSDSIENEWLRHLQDQHRRLADAERKAMLAEEDEWNQLPNGVYTTAELRPNAYIPIDDPLPVPKHYGALAPFKPTEPGANIRHIRKPKIKPIEI